MFYINYEECKCKASIATLKVLSCFILTMRNVNKLNSKIGTLEGDCFILTMRNVNMSVMSI